MFVGQYLQPSVYILEQEELSKQRLEILSEGGVEWIREERGEERKLRQPDPVECSIVLNLSTVTQDSEQERNRLTEGDAAREDVIIVSVPQVRVHIKPHISFSSMDYY